VYLLWEINGGTIHLPIGLYEYETRREIITFNHAFLELRYVPEYLDFYVTFYPIQLRVPLKNEDRASSLFKSFGMKTGFFTISELTIRLHFMYGPKPVRENYAETYQFQIGNITGHLFHSQIVSIGTVGSCDSTHNLSKMVEPFFLPFL
jgi:hypothetical protein